MKLKLSQVAKKGIFWAIAIVSFTITSCSKGGDTPTPTPTPGGGTFKLPEYATVVATSYLNSGSYFALSSSINIDDDGTIAANTKDATVENTAHLVAGLKQGIPTEFHDGLWALNNWSCGYEDVKVDPTTKAITMGLSTDGVHRKWTAVFDPQTTTAKILMSITFDEPIVVKLTDGTVLLAVTEVKYTLQ